MKHGKRYNELIKKVDTQRAYGLEEAVELVKQTGTTKFTESVDIAVRLGVDPRKADQMVRGTVSLPNGTGKQVRVLVLAKPPNDDAARSAGADHVGFDDYIEKIKGGWTDVDVIIATPDIMSEVGKLGKILGPRGLMPNPKSGTVTNDLANAVKEVKAGKIEFRVDKGGVVHATVGKVDFTAKDLIENVKAFLSTIQRLKPPSSKGNYIKSVTVSTTMGPGISIDRTSFGTAA